MALGVVTHPAIHSAYERHVRALAIERTYLIGTHFALAGRQVPGNPEQFHELLKRWYWTMDGPQRAFFEIKVPGAYDSKYNDQFVLRVQYVTFRVAISGEEWRLWAWLYDRLVNYSYEAQNGQDAILVWRRRPTISYEGRKIALSCRLAIPGVEIHEISGRWQAPVILESKR